MRTKARTIKKVCLHIDEAVIVIEKGTTVEIGKTIVDRKKFVIWYRELYFSIQ